MKGYSYGDDKFADVFFYCTNNECRRSFVGHYAKDGSGHFVINSISSGNLSSMGFSEEINKISPSFVKIYNEAYAAEQYNLNEISGVGYRKSLEFLIKDYVLFINMNKKDFEEKVRKKFLGKCIEEYVEDKRIKEISKRAVWLGNDETHYTRKWGKELSELKKLIDLTVHWIEAEELSKDIVKNMTDNKDADNEVIVTEKETE